jgi:hypothetical protein
MSRYIPPTRAECEANRLDILKQAGWPDANYTGRIGSTGRSQRTHYVIEEGELVCRWIDEQPDSYSNAQLA